MKFVLGAALLLFSSGYLFQKVKSDATVYAVFAIE